ncbi:TPA: hypothetical protein ACS72K_004051, partial [Providencia alcalifaciens]
AVPNNPVPKLLWKRGSKLGVEITASGAGNKIHFILDQLDLEQVVTKAGKNGQSVTASELRYIYRNRERLAGRIHFYQDGVETDAPWVANPKLWSDYSPKTEDSRELSSHITGKSQRKGLIQRFTKIFK